MNRRRTDNELLSAALSAEYVDDIHAARQEREAHRNWERVAHWRHRALLATGHWPQGTPESVRTWHQVALAHDMAVW